MEDPTKSVKLSKGILDMKFMKKTKERVLQDEDDAEGHAMYSNEITEEMKRTGNIVFLDTSLGHCRDLINGRLSFGGMNPDIEKQMANDNAKKLEQLERQKEKDVSDADMAKGFSAINKKFRGKRGKRAFLKPNDDDHL